MHIPEPDADGLRRYKTNRRPEGIREDRTRCVVAVNYGGHSWYQCARRRGAGLNGEFCAQHAKMWERYVAHVNRRDIIT